MRYLLALILMVPALAQQPEQPAKPADPAAAAPAPAPPPALRRRPTRRPNLRCRRPPRTGSPAASISATAGSTDAGNFQAYRSVVNLGQGPKLTGLDFTILDPKKRLFDRLDARAYGWGGDPYTTAHVDARKQGIYDFSFDYRNIAYFNAVPSFANPLAPAGFDEQAFDTHRRNTSVSLDLRPGKHIIPYLAFDRNSGYGHGIETWVQDANDEFAVPTLLRDYTNNYRGGVRIECNCFHVTLEAGRHHLQGRRPGVRQRNQLRRQHRRPCSARPWSSTACSRPTASAAAAFTARRWPPPARSRGSTSTASSCTASRRRTCTIRNRRPATSPCSARCCSIAASRIWAPAPPISRTPPATPGSSCGRSAGCGSSNRG